jgi:hypothetical protein
VAAHSAGAAGGCDFGDDVPDHRDNAGGAAFSAYIRDRQRASRSYKSTTRNCKFKNSFRARSYFRLHWRKKDTYLENIKNIMALSALGEVLSGEEGSLGQMERELEPRPTLQVAAEVGGAALRATLDFGSPISVCPARDLVRFCGEENVVQLPRRLQRTFGSAAAGATVRCETAGHVPLTIQGRTARVWIYGGTVPRGCFILGCGHLQRLGVLPLLSRGVVLVGARRTLVPLLGREKGAAVDYEETIKNIFLPRNTTPGPVLGKR